MSKEPIRAKNPLTSRVNSSVPLTYRDPRYLGLNCLVKKPKMRFHDQNLSDFSKNPILDFPKETHPKFLQ